MLQNYVHTKAIQGLLGFQHLKVSIVPLVVFTKASKLKIAGTSSVVHLSNLVKTIKNYAKIVYSDTQCDEIINLLMGANIVDKQMRKAHIKEIRAIKKAK
ncbi:MAG: hypothetical protein HN929_01330 [Chloroflexi bacterium]|jgi:hypothetical protein|nr:hypothetical protein [Chloroflexota bacterium]